MEKLKMHSPNFADENIERLAELFPNCVTEVREPRMDTNKHELGQNISENSCEFVVKKAIDFDLLRQELSDHIVEGPRERYHLNWPGKREALLTANAPIAKTLRPYREESVNFDTTENLFIEGDNLDALKLLQETYLGKVKMIYIDPPYNTGKDFIYADNFSETTEEYLLESGQKDEEGNRLIANTDSNGRYHSDWLSMMYSRLKLARNLLSIDGVVFISIDDNEAHNLKKICDEIFGANNFIAQLAVQLNPRGRHLDSFIAKTHESVVIFGKDATAPSTMNGVEKEGRMVDEYNRTDERGSYRVLGLRNRNQAFNPTTRPNLYYPLYINPQNGSVSLVGNETSTDEVFPDTADGIKTCWTWGREKIEKENNLLIAEKTGNEWRIFRKDYLLDKSGKSATTLPKSLWIDKEINNDYGRKTIKNLFGKSLMDFPKSVELLIKLVKSGMNSGDIILDFFAGSATTAHAVMQLNAEDGGKRKFIMVQLPEETDEKSETFKAGYKTIAEISKERIRRAGKKIKANHELTRIDTNKEKNNDLFKNNSCELVSIRGSKALDVGFRVLKVDSSNMADIYYTPDAIEQDLLTGLSNNIKDDRASEDLLFQVLLDWGVDLTLPITKETITDREVFFVDGNALVACFEKAGQITEDFCKELAKRQPLRVVFRDSGFKDDSVKINVEQIFKLMSPHTDVKTI